MLVSAALSSWKEGNRKHQVQAPEQGPEAEADSGTCPAVVYRCSCAELSSEQMNSSWLSFSLVC